MVGCLQRLVPEGKATLRQMSRVRRNSTSLHCPTSSASLRDTAEHRGMGSGLCAVPLGLREEDLQ